MTLRHLQDVDAVPGSAGDVLRLIRGTESMSRSTLARTTGLAPSTISLRVDVLEQLGLVTEGGSEDSRGGRRARRLELVGGSGFVAAADLGANHTRVVLSDLSGRVVVDTDALDPASADQEHRSPGRAGETPPSTVTSGMHTASRLPIADGPAAAVDALWQRIIGLATLSGLSMDRFRGLAIGVPAPIAYPSGRIVTPSFQPSWHNADLPGLFARHTDAPVLVDNDANLIALAEHAEGDRTDTDQLLALKLGTRIGCGIIASGRLHRGVGGAAGEISHTAVDGVSRIGCTCGVPNCLESVASGGAIAATLRAQGFHAETAPDVLALGARGEGAAIEALREAGTRIGTALSAMVNFFNPSEVVLAGTMSASLPFVAAIRAELFRTCLPIVAETLEVRASRNPRDAGIRGASVLIIDEVLAPARIDAMVRDAVAQPVPVRSA